MMTDFSAWGAPLELGSRRILHPGPLRWLRATGWMLLLFVLFGVYYGGGQMLLPQDGWPTVVGNAAFAAVAVGLYVLAVRLGEARIAGEFGLASALRDSLIGLFVGLAMMAAVMGVMFAAGLYDFRLNESVSAWKGVGLAIESGVVEELIFRAVMLRLLWRAFGPIPAFLVSAAFFGLVHFGNPNSGLFAAVCIAVEAGVMLGAFYALTGRVWMSIGVHAAWNFAQGWLFGAPVSGTDFGPALAVSTPSPGASPLLTGGAFGPEASVPGLAVGAAVGIAVLWLAWKAGRFARPAAAG